jgi:hypothetical protein
MHVVIRLVSGDEFMCVLESEDEYYVLVKDPISVKTIPILEEGREHVITAPLSQFTDDTEYVFEKHHVLYVKKLSSKMIPHYERIVESHKHVDNFRPADDAFDGEEISAEEALKRIEMLKKIFGEEKEESQPVDSTFVKGSDTIH